MGQIKFRAWDTALNRWNYFIEIDCYGRLQEYKYNGSAFYAKYKNDYEENYEDVSNRFIICQFTGLFDVNGKEVYEGDILRMYKYSSGEPCVVTFDHGCYMCSPFGTLEAATLYGTVIGNIYETPELLTKQ